MSRKRAAVYVHGLFGWGERDGLYTMLPYWGLTSCDILTDLASQSYVCHAASMGALSSAWDRACELYAQLCGTTADYGVAHSEKFGHARYGVTYKTPLVENWQDCDIDFVAHSFGGATARLFMDILANGRPDEVEAARAAGETPSPFFEGGKAACVHSLTTIASPHNGSSLMDCCGDRATFIVSLLTGVAKALGISDYKGAYDFQLDQFGIRRVPGEKFGDTIARIIAADFLGSGDHALRDLSIDSSQALNAKLGLFPDVYYFSYPCCRSHCALTSYKQKPDASMTPILAGFSRKMGAYYDQRTPEGRPIGKEWLPNDGLVNTVSAMYPSGDKFVLSADGADFAPGVWNVMPVTRQDHFAIMGGFFNANRRDILAFYRNVMQNIDTTYKK
jgi:triacylglycerol lipase